MRHLVVGALAVLLAISHAAAAHASDFTLAWSPPADPPKLSKTDPFRTAFLKEKVRFEIADKREEGRVVIEAGSTKHESKDDIAVFYAKHFTETLSGYGVQVVDKDETLVIRASVRKALGTKTKGPPENWGRIVGGVFAADRTYLNGEFIVLCDVRRKEQADFVWAGQARGRFSVAGTDVIPNYQIALSGAVQDAARALLDDPDLLEKLVTPPQRVAPPPSDGPRRKPVAPARSP